MNVDPVRANSTGIDQTAEKTLHAAPLPPNAASGSTPYTETATIQNASVPLLFPEHEVKVQLDSPTDDIIVYQVLDKQSGALVLQVPSAEHLRGIHQSQELLQRIAARGKGVTSNAAS